MYAPVEAEPANPYRSKGATSGMGDIPSVGDLDKTGTPRIMVINITGLFIHT